MSRKERRPNVLSLHSMGSAAFPRFVISDQSLRYWSGTDWTLNKDEALVYEDGNAGCEEMQRLLKLNFKHLPLRHFRAPVYLDLYSDQNFSLKELEKWLVQVSKLLIDPAPIGNGPVEGSLGLVRINWSELEEVP